jgi:hypothetical protein
MKALSNNRDLYEYLLFLASVLEQRGATALSEIVQFASRLASTFPATEFLGESRIALRRVLGEENGILNDQERTDLCDVLKQLDSAFNRP